MRINSTIAAMAASVCVIALATPAQAEQRQFLIPAGSLKDALDSFGRQSGRPIIYRSEDVRGAKSKGFKGVATTDDALHAILSGSGFSFSATSDGAIAIKTGEASAGSAAANSESAEIVVTGTRIRGAPSSSPVITLTADRIRASGQSSLGEAARSLPQSFGGGQNPGVNLGIGGANQNLTGGSSINLRGLGPDATLTLLNGHRLSYGSFVQAVDISAIPFAAVDRLEIVADGTSALYGSDAVGGVANIILKRDYSGLSAGARFAAATEGGDHQQEYNIVTGSRWSSGGFIIAYDYERDTPITALQRGYLSYMPSDSTVLPGSSRHSAVLSLHQNLTSALEFTTDVIFNHRSTAYTIIVPGSARSDVFPTDKSYAVSPALKYKVSPSVSISVSGVYGQERTPTIATTTSATSVTSVYTCYCNNIRSVEASAEGNLFGLPAGQVRFAAGSGYRYNRFEQPNTSTHLTVEASQKSYYGFGELFIPIVGQNNEVAGVRSLSLSGAIRYESYPNVANVATPKVGIIYSPTEDFDIKGSWGKSFKAPTLAQEHQYNYVYLYKASSLGGSYPATATALYETGGYANLKPEKADTWTATIAFHPKSLPGMKLELSYFNLTYRDRVVQPIQGTNFATSLSDARYANFVTANPSAQAQAATIAQAVSGLNNLSGLTYTPTNVIAIVQNTYLNAATQHFKGVDLIGSYRIELTDKKSLTLSGSVSWLDSHQQLNAAVPMQDLAGTIFNPAHFRARAGAIWQSSHLEFAAYANYTGSEVDNRNLPYASIDSQTTGDIAIHYRVGKVRPFGDLDVGIAVQNIFDAKPSYAKQAAVYYVNYDSTNQSPVGRLISLTVNTRW